MFTEKVENIASSFNDDKGLELFDKVNHIYFEQVLEQYAKKNCWNLLKQTD